MPPDHRLLRIFSTIIASAILAYSISYVYERINILEKFSTAVTDIDFTDLYYQSRPAPKPDENITLVNIGLKNRSEIAHILNTISKHNPKVIAGDIFFGQEADTIDVIGTQVLINEIRSIKNLVLPSSYNRNMDKGSGLTAQQTPLIRAYIKEGVINFNIATDDPEYGTVRSFRPVTEINGNEHLSFGFLIASYLDSSVLHHVTGSDMMIRWYGYGNRDRVSEDHRIFKTIDAHQIDEGGFEAEDIKGKIVLLGFMGESLWDYEPEQQFFTPLNRKLIGRSLPDMYGVEVHANIIKMIVDKDFTFNSRVTDFLFSLSIILIFTVLLMRIQLKYPNQYSILSKIALILFADILVLGTIGIFYLTHGDLKFLVGNGLLVMLFLPDTYEFVNNNVFRKLSRRKGGTVFIKHKRINAKI